MPEMSHHSCEAWITCNLSARVQVDAFAKILQVIAARQASMRKRTSAGLAAVDAMGPGSIVALLLVAVLALAWARGVAAVQAAAWLIRCTDIYTGL